MISAERLTKTYYHDWYRANGRARERLEPTGGRNVLNIPLYMLRKRFAAIRRLAAAVLSRDKEGLLTRSLWLYFYGGYYLQQIRPALSRAGAITTTVRTRG